MKIKTWKSEASMKGESYKGYRIWMHYEPLLDLLNRKHRKVMLKFILSDHKLSLKEGSKNTKRKQVLWFCSTEEKDRY